MHAFVCGGLCLTNCSFFKTKTPAFIFFSVSITYRFQKQKKEKNQKRQQTSSTLSFNKATPTVSQTYLLKNPPLYEFLIAVSVSALTESHRGRAVHRISRVPFLVPV